MDFNNIKIKELVLKSELTKEDQENLLSLFSKARDEDLKEVVNLFENDFTKIKIISDIYKAKSRVFKNQDKKGWREILEEEHKGLKGLEE